MNHTWSVSPGTWIRNVCLNDKSFAYIKYKVFTYICHFMNEAIYYDSYLLSWHARRLAPLLNGYLCLTSFTNWNKDKSICFEQELFSQALSDHRQLVSNASSPLDQLLLDGLQYLDLLFLHQSRRFESGLKLNYQYRLLRDACLILNHYLLHFTNPVLQQHVLKNFNLLYVY